MRNEDMEAIGDGQDEDELPPDAVPIDLQLSTRDAQPHEAPNAEEDLMAGLHSNVAQRGPTPPPVPVLLLTGFLGAGKTTLVNYILSEQHGYRCAVLLNEIGDSADIEKALIRDPEGDEPAPLAEWVQLENGCICCSVKNDMVQALESLVGQRDRFDYVIIETTGLANPGPVAAALWTDKELEAAVCLDAIVTVVDAKNILRHLDNKAEAAQQIAFADLVLINKCDLVSREGLAVVEAAIRSVNSEVEIMQCTRCEVDLGKLLNTGLYTGDGKDDVMNDNDSCCEMDASACIEHNHRHQHNDKMRHHHEHDIRTVTIIESRPLDLRRLRHWLDELLWEEDGEPNSTEMFRIKGFLNVETEHKAFILQAVHEIYDVREGPEWSLEAPKRSKFVFIGRNLDESALSAGIARCCSTNE
jgi:G3E family GTPase